MNDEQALQLTRELGTMYTVAVMLPVTAEITMPAFLQFGSLEEAEAVVETMNEDGHFLESVLEEIGIGLFEGLLLDNAMDALANKPRREISIMAAGYEQFAAALNNKLTEMDRL